MSKNYSESFPRAGTKIDRQSVRRSIDPSRSRLWGGSLSHFSTRKGCDTDDAIKELPGKCALPVGFTHFQQISCIGPGNHRRPARKACTLRGMLAAGPVYYVFLLCSLLCFLLCFLLRFLLCFLLRFLLGMNLDSRLGPVEPDAFCFVL